MMERKGKEISEAQISGFLRAHLKDGDLLAVGGLFKQGRPTALVREVLRAGLKELKIVSSPGSGFDFDLMIAAGAVAETFCPAVTLEDRMCPAFRGAVEAGRIRAHCVDALSVVGGYLASANGVPFQPVVAWRGSDVPKNNPLVAEMGCPFTGEQLFATRAIRPKVALIHAQEGDRFGNLRHLSTMTYADQLIARASDLVIASVDRIVAPQDILSRPRETSIPGIYVDAVVELPYAAHPSGSFPHYSIDEQFIETYAALAEADRKGDGAGLADYLARTVTGCKTQAEYVAAIGKETLNELKTEARAL
ncbi:CoA transferase subunit A [Sulfitobacter dubius]|uniref:3-oxoadipate CoA-transferase subunit A n=1 Tax=Sulfitobacter dubius TaxID=218673 RepID=A0ABY3ZRE3_9RHOB|nr:CoA-transferase [Sulfitobacter dubius]UOA17193.1 3-oxoadipate CoA-transferase subunit A [Sulfitobacter dubius]